MDVGCVRMTERHLTADPASEDQIAAAVADVHAALDAAIREVPLAQTRTLVGLAGTITTVTAQALGLPAYDRDKINGARLPVDAVIAACDALLSATRAEREALPFMHPGRVDVIGAGALVWREVVARVRDEVAAAGGGDRGRHERARHPRRHRVLGGLARVAARTCSARRPFGPRMWRV
ncbi:hypothetical protein GCM10025876_11950 [Demequina litorisediminis]|uniref:Ppx/GppA phosphatase N-terminal domain-containing protein n=1 Tax=Demequina litorisediminis TaxID=1849022 RepID=A0ABQ6IBB8_9MICO|nr:hypothetical protein GCM10025876_11950 [Demequina litorisediminis]